MVKNEKVNLQGPTPYFPDVWSVINHDDQFGSIGNQHWNLVFNKDDLKTYEMLNKDLKIKEHRVKYNQCNIAMTRLIFSGGPPYRVPELNNRIPMGFHDSAKIGLFLRAEWFQTLGANEFWRYKTGREYK
jgi:hypothetical protein